MNARNNKKIILLFDFDGTLTKVPGSKVVFTPFYKSLLEDPNQKYTAATFKPVEKLHELMKAEFTRYAEENEGKRDPRRITPSALNFFNEVLAMPEVDIAIITRNQPHYVKAMLKLEGVDKDKVDQLPIYPFISKDYAAASFLKDYTPNAVFGFDDSDEDARAIYAGAKSACEDVTVYKKDPGDFTWDIYLQEIKKKLQSPNPSAFFSASQKATGQNTESENKAELGNPKIGYGQGTG